MRATLPAEVPAGADGQGLGVGLCVGDRTGAVLESSFTSQDFSVPLKEEQTTVLKNNRPKSYLIFQEIIF